MVHPDGAGRAREALRQGVVGASLARLERREQAACSKAVKAMKITIEVDMTPEEARKFLGLPDVKDLQDRMLGEMERRMKAAIDGSDPQSLMKAWLPVGAEGFSQFQQFLWDSARKATGAPKKDPPKSGR
jgi:hypothetical protein